ncbi:MAG: sigma-70 family RNA polymerase sigma factor [Oceanospirillaceae bacterium]|nr:sigma-70 family RNA polymerase sigma factor [Oceanospirillaceae bacterium]
MDKIEWGHEVDVLLYRVQAQDKQALQLLYELTSSKLLGLIFRIVKDESESEDVLQDVFIKVWLQANQFNGKGSAWGWLCVMARNSSLDRLRKVQRHPSVSTDEDEALLDSLIEEFDGSTNIAINRCLMTLKEQVRKSILMSYLHGYSHTDLADKMAIPLGTMKAWCRRGLKELKLCLEA